MWICAGVLVAVAVVAFLMAAKGLSADRLLPFHQVASGRDWESFGTRERALAMALTPLAGIGFPRGRGWPFLVPPSRPALGAAGYACVLAALAAVFCAGLALINHRLQAATGAATPWKGSLYAAAVTLLAIVLLLTAPR